MTATVPQIFDRNILRLRRARAALRFGNFSFLAERAAQELSDRLAALDGRLDTPVACGAVVPRGVERRIRLDTTAAMVAGDAYALAGDEERLPFAPGSLDLFASVLTLHAINDLPGALAQIRWALRHDGLFMAALFGGETLKELRQALAEAEIERDGGLSPRVFPFADVRDMGGLLQRANFALPVADADTFTVAYDHPLKLMRDLRGMGETNVLVERKRRFLRRRTLERACEIYIDKFSDGDGRVRATFQIIYATGRARFEAQQQPLDDDTPRLRLG